MKNLTGRQDMGVLSAVGSFLSNSGRYEVNLQQMRIVVYNSVLTKQGCCLTLRRLRNTLYTRSG